MLPAAYARLGELRRRQGRTEDASQLLEQAGRHPLALLNGAWIDIQQGNPPRGLDHARAYLAVLSARAILASADGANALAADLMEDAVAL